MPVKVTLEYDEMPQELGALEQQHNAGRPALEPGYEVVQPYVNRAGYEPTESQLLAMEMHPESFQFHNAGRPAVESAGGNERCVPLEWSADLSTH